MPTVDFGACLSNYWFIWLINGVGSIFGLTINMAISYFFLKYFHNITSSNPSASKKSKSSFSQFGNTPPPSDLSVDAWPNDPTMRNAYNSSRV